MQLLTRVTLSGVGSTAVERELGIYGPHVPVLFTVNGTLDEPRGAKAPRWCTGKRRGGVERARQLKSTRIMIIQTQSQAFCYFSLK